MSQEIDDQVQKILSAVEAALRRYYDSPDNRCSDCGARRAVRPVTVSETNGADTPWEVRGGSRAGEPAGWVDVRPNIGVSGRVNERVYCPDCAKKRGIDFTKEHSK